MFLHFSNCLTMENKELYYWKHSICLLSYVQMKSVSNIVSNKYQKYLMPDELLSKMNLLQKISNLLMQQMKYNQVLKILWSHESLFSSLIFRYRNPERLEVSMLKHFKRQEKFEGKLWKLKNFYQKQIKFGVIFTKQHISA